MASIIFAIGLKDNFTEDIYLLSKRWSTDPRITVAPPQAAREAIQEKASSLFVEENAVLAMLDPPQAVISESAETLSILKDRMGIIIYSTAPDSTLPPSLEAQRVNMETEKQERIKAKVLASVRLEGKKMTDKAYALLKERVRDEAILEQELAKLIDYVGDKKIIEVKDVAAVVTEMHEEDLIALSEALACKDKNQMMVILHRLFSQGANILAIHGFMARHIGLLLQSRDAQELFASADDFRQFSKGFSRLKESLGSTPLERRNFLAYQKPYYAYNLCKTGRKFSEENLATFLSMLARFDRMVKRGTKHDRTNFEVGLLEV